jgi:CheY-like chemotaxis protein
MGSKILLADDSITIQKVVNLTFADEGIEVVAVSNGDTAERRLAEVNPDLVLADIFMPGKNGYELCEYIKRSAQFSKVPVVLLIGAFEPFNEAEARRVHADAHLTKPFESRTLVETVRKLINVGGQPRTGPIAPVPVPEPPVTELPVPEAPVQEAPRQSLLTKNMVALGPEDFPPVTASASMALPSEMSADSLNEAAPLDIDYSPADMPVSVTTDAQPLSDDYGSSGWSRRTDDLIFSTDQAPFQSFGLNDLNIEAGELAAPIAVAVEEQLSDFSVNTEIVNTPLGFSPEQDVRIDYGKSEGQTDYEVIGFDVDPHDPLDVDADKLHVEEESQTRATQPHSFNTTRLDISVSQIQDDGSVDTNPLEMPAASGDADFNFGGQASDSGDPSSLLTVDEPLGDVLMDESVRESFSTEQTQASEQPLDQSLTGEAFNIEFIPQETAEALPGEFQETVPTPTTGVEVVTGETNQTTDAQSAVEQQMIGSNEYAETASFERLSAPVEETVQGEPSSKSDSAYGFESAEQASYDSNGSASRQPVHGSDFTAYSTWPGEEASFAPIDIEATTVDEPAVADVNDEVGEPEKGFEFASSAATQASQEPAQSVAPVTEEPLAVEPAAELSPALIDEIVRRVVTQISDSVVREIAWEVVPDCVERVIKDLTRQELSKR